MGVLEWLVVAARILKVLTPAKSAGRKRSRCYAVVFCVAGLLRLGTPVFADPASDSAKTLEYRIKAAFLYNFARFVEWPQEDAWNERKLVIGVLGKDPFGPILDETVRGKKTRGRPLEIKRLSHADDMASCDLVFVSSSERWRIETLLTALHGAQVLTVSETPNFLDKGGMINFVIENKRVRIDLNLSTTRAAGLSVSSQLILVAREVHQE